MSEVVKYTQGGVPVKLSASTAVSVIDPVVAEVGKVIEAIIREGIRITGAVVIACSDAHAEVAFYTERNRYYRTNVVPVLAMASAVNVGSSQLQHMGLNPAIQAKAQAKLDRLMD